MPTSSDTLALLQRSRREIHIEDVLFSYPELIAAGWGRPRRQVELGEGNRLDLLFSRPKEHLIVEIKRGTIGLAECRQIERYLKKLERPSIRSQGILVGRSINASARHWLKDTFQRISYLQWGTDIPANVSVCWECRKAYDARLAACPNDGETRYL